METRVIKKTEIRRRKVGKREEKTKKKNTKER